MLSNYYECLSELDDLFLGDLIFTELKSKDAKGILEALKNLEKPYYLQEMEFKWNSKIRCCIEFSELKLFQKMKYVITMDGVGLCLIELLIDHSIERTIDQIVKSLKTHANYFKFKKIRQVYDQLETMLKEYKNYEHYETTRYGLVFYSSDTTKHTLTVECVETQLDLLNARARNEEHNILLISCFDEVTRVQLKHFLDFYFTTEELKSKREQFFDEIMQYHSYLELNQSMGGGDVKVYNYHTEDDVVKVTIDYSISKIKMKVSITGFYGNKISMNIRDASIDDLDNLQYYVEMLNDQDVRDTCY